MASTGSSNDFNNFQVFRLFCTLSPKVQSSFEPEEKDFRGFTSWEFAVVPKLHVPTASFLVANSAHSLFFDSTKRSNSHLRDSYQLTDCVELPQVLLPSVSKTRREPPVLSAWVTFYIRMA